MDDLVAGTYIIHVEFADAGRAPAPANPAEPPYVDYRTPSVAVATFQVKTATVEKPVAGNCTACHWSSAGVGFVLDFPRHNKIFDEKAVDRCGGCHDYSSGQKPDATTQLSYAGSLSNRVHSVHNGVKPQLPDDHGGSRGDRCLRPQLADHLPDGYPQLRVLPSGSHDERHLEDQCQSSGLHGVS